MAFQGIV